MGDPAGIGPEVTIKALSDSRISKLAHFLIIGDFSVIDRVKNSLRTKADISLLDLANVPSTNFAFGVPRPAFGKAAMEYIDKAFMLIKAGEADALVTAPINKSSIRSAGFKDFEGHTEYLAQMSATDEFAMMFVGRDLKITLCSRHIALRDVANAITPDIICRTIRLTYEYLKRYFGIKNPRIAVTGLNPHASDNGLFGDEEERVIIPAIKKMSAAIKNILYKSPTSSGKSEKITDCLWLNNDYIIFTAGDKITISEIDYRGNINAITLPQTIAISPDKKIDIKNPQIFFNQQSSKLYILTADTLLLSERIIP